jgi:hypothetical protein
VRSNKIVNRLVGPCWWTGGKAFHVGNGVLVVSSKSRIGIVVIGGCSSKVTHKDRWINNS